MYSLWKLIIANLLIVGFSACGGGDSSGGDTVSSNLTGSAQKGPFEAGSIVTAYELNSTLDRNGTQHTTDIEDNLGSYVFSNTIQSQFVEVVANGFFYDEITGQNSTIPIELSVVLDTRNGNISNLNILTTIARERIKKLVSDGIDFSQAESRATEETLKIFKLQDNLGMQLNKFNLLSDSEQGAVLLAASTILMQAAHDDSNHTLSIALNTLIDNIKTDLQDNGTINSPDINEKLRNASKNINLSEVATLFNNQYSTIPSLEFYIDSDGDGVIGKNKLQKLSTVEVGNPNDTIQSFLLSNGGQYLLVALNNVVTIYDLTTPSNPIKRGVLSIDKTGFHDMEIADDNKTVFAKVISSTFKPEIVAFSIEDPDSPVLLGTISTAIGQGYETLKLSPNNNTLYQVSEGGGLRIIDVTDPTDMSLINTYRDGTYLSRIDLSHNGTYAFVLSNSYGLEMLNVSDPNNIQVVDTLPGLSGTLKVSTEENSLLLFSSTSDSKISIQKYNFSDLGFFEDSLSTTNDNSTYQVKYYGEIIYAFTGNQLIKYQFRLSGELTKLETKEADEGASVFYEISPQYGYIAMRFYNNSIPGFYVYGY